jgi:hypothetical protein
VSARVTGNQARILAALVERDNMTRAELIDRMYGHRADGGPDDTKRNFKVTLCYLRKALRARGLEIETYNPQWHVGCRYRIPDGMKDAAREFLGAVNA